MREKLSIYRIINLISGTVLASILLMLTFADSREGRATAPVSLAGYQLPNMCFHRAVTGSACPGCGLVRGLTAAMHGDMQEARNIHPYAPWMLAWSFMQLTLRLALAVFVSKPVTAVWVADSLFSSATLMCAAYGPIFWQFQ